MIKLINMKSNSEIYPYVPFADLSNKDIKNNFVEKKEISLEELKEFVLSLENPQPNIQGKTVAERILSIFMDENFFFGPREYIEENKKTWLDKLNYFISKKEPIQFTILALPFKIPVPLKTNRVLPDMGEVLFLLRLNLITQLIVNEYQPGAQITVLAEGVFSDFVGIEKIQADNYYQAIKGLNDKLGFGDNIKIIPLSVIKEYTADFDKAYKQKVNELKKLYQTNDKEFLKKYNNTYQVLGRIVAPPELDEQILMDVYNDQLADSQVADNIFKIRNQIKEKAHHAIFQYFAFFLVRDEIDLLEQLVPHSLSLSVSPKKDRLGIVPVNKDCVRLPYHAVPVYDKNKFSLEYLIDIKRTKNKYILVYLKNDSDNTPFYYIVYEK